MKYLIFTLILTFLLGLGVDFAYFPKKAQPTLAIANLPSTPVFLASKKGEVFGLPWCGSMPRIKDENILVLSHKSDALEMGLRPMKGCRGLDENP